MFGHKQLLGCGFVVVLVIGFVGCGSSNSGSAGSHSGVSMDAMADQADAQIAARKQQEAAAAAKVAADQQAAQAQVAQTPPEPGRKVGGRAPIQGGGYYSAIAGAHRHVMNVVDSLSWIQGVRSYKAEKGRKPKDNAEFMKDVVKYYDLQLPRIEEDEEYFYDPKGETDGDFGQLYVVKKKTESEADQTPTQK
jgi:hypothetical protein